jgi:hypothetical protein
MSGEMKALLTKGKRMSLVAQLVETFDTPADRKGFVLGMRDCGAISDQAAELLLEAYGLEGV